VPSSDSGRAGAAGRSQWSAAPLSTAPASRAASGLALARPCVTASGQLRYRLAGNRRIRLAGSPDGRWQRCDRAGRCEIVEEAEAFTEEMAR